MILNTTFLTNQAVVLLVCIGILIFYPYVKLWFLSWRQRLQERTVIAACCVYIPRRRLGIRNRCLEKYDWGESDFAIKYGIKVDVDETRDGAVRFLMYETKVNVGSREVTVKRFPEGVVGKESIEFIYHRLVKEAFGIEKSTFLRAHPLPNTVKDNGKGLITLCIGHMYVDDYVKHDESQMNYLQKCELVTALDLYRKLGNELNDYAKHVGFKEVSEALNWISYRYVVLRNTCARSLRSIEEYYAQAASLEKPQYCCEEGNCFLSKN